MPSVESQPAIVWPISGGYILMQNPPEATGAGIIYGCSPDGAWFVGNVPILTPGATASQYIPIRWARDGTYQILDHLTPGGVYAYYPTDISEDGGLVFGIQSGPSNTNKMMVWDRAGRRTELQPVPGYDYSYTEFFGTTNIGQRHMSRDGRYIPGFSWKINGFGIATVWEDGVPRALNGQGGYPYWSSRNGNILFGNTGQPFPCYWERVSGATRMVTLIPGTITTYAYGDVMNADGSIYHGRAVDSLTTVEFPFGVWRNVYWDDLYTPSEGTDRYGVIHIKENLGNTMSSTNAGEGVVRGVADSAVLNISVGDCPPPESRLPVACRWDGTMITRLDGLSGTTTHHSTAVCVSENGQVVGGNASDNTNDYPVRWDSAKHLTILPTPDNRAASGFYGVVTGATPDGQYLYGRVYLATYAGVCIPPDPINAPDPVPVEEPVTAWTLEPDWANGVRETLSWKTDVLTSQTRIEQRRRLRNSPRRRIEADFTLLRSDRRLYDNLMQGPAAGFWHYPMWWEKFFLTAVAPVGSSTVVCGSTTGTEITVGDTVVLLGRTPFIHEIAEIASVTPTEFGFAMPLTRQWPVGSTLYLTRRCRVIDTQRGQRRADDAFQVTLTFETTEPNDYVGIPPTYALDYPVLELLPNDAEDMTEEYVRILAEFDNQTAAVPIRRDLSGFA